jgi:hypothetical protein
MTIDYSSLLQIDKDEKYEIKNLQLESHCDIHPFSNIVYCAIFSNFWRVIKRKKNN